METSRSSPPEKSSSVGLERRRRSSYRVPNKTKSPRAPRLRLLADRRPDRARLTIDASGPLGIVGAIAIVVVLAYALYHCGAWLP
jgi:hypothetical protein